MGCNNADTAKCAACHRGGTDPAAKPKLDKTAARWYNAGKTRKQTQARKNAKAHKAYHIRRMNLG